MAKIIGYGFEYCDEHGDWCGWQDEDAPYRTLADAKRRLNGLMRVLAKSGNTDKWRITQDRVVYTRRRNKWAR